MADLTISVDIDARGAKTGAGAVKSEIQGIKQSVAGIDLKALGDKLKSVGATMQQFGGQMRQVGTTMTIAVTAPIVAAGAAILKAGAEYETALNIFQAVTKATAEEMARAAQISKELGADLTLPATSAKDAALAMNELGKAGLTANQAMDAARGVLQLAAAGTLEEARAAEIAANALNAFHLEAKEATRIADLLAAAANSSSAEVEDIALAMQQAGANFAAAKIPIEDMVTAISAMANAGIKGSDAGTSLKTFIISLQAPTKAAAKTMQDLGIAVFDAAGKMRPMPELIGQFERALAGLTDEQKAIALNKIFGSDAIRAAQILFATGTEGFNKLKEQVTATGAAADLANAKMKGLGGEWEKFKSQLETIGIRIYDVVKVPLTNFLRDASEWAGRLGDAFGNLSPGTQTAIIAFVAFAAVIGPLLVVLGAVVGAIGTIVGAIGTLVAMVGGGSVVALALAGIGVLLAELAIGAAIFYAAWQTNFGGIREYTATVADAVVTAWNAMLVALNDLTQALLAEIQRFWATNGEDIKEIVREASEFIKSTWTAVAQFWSENSETIKAATSAVWDAVKTIIVGAVRIIGDVITLFLKVAKGDWQGAWKAMKSIVQTAWTAIGAIVNAQTQIILGLVKRLFNAIWDLNAWVLQKARELGEAIGQGIRNGILAMKDRVVAAAREIANAIPESIRKLLGIASPSKVTHDIGRQVASGLADGMNAGTAEAVKTAQTMGQKVLGALNALVGGNLLDFIRNAFDVMLDSSKSWSDKLKTIFGGIVQNFRKMTQDMLLAWIGSKIGAGSGPGGTPYFNPGAGGIFGGGGFGGLGGTPGFNPAAGNGPGGILPTGSIDANGNYVVNGNTSGGFFSSGIFAPIKPMFGKTSALGGQMFGAGGILGLIGGMVGGRVGGVLSYAGTGMQIGAMIGGPIGGAIGAGIGALVGIFKANSLRRKEEKIRNAGILEAFKALRTGFDEIIAGVRGLRIDPASGLAQGTALGQQVREQYLQMANALTDKKTRRHALQDVSRVDSLIAEKMALLRAAADISFAAGDRDRRLIPEFARGVYMSPAFMQFRRMNGMLGGAWTGRDTIPAMLAAGEMVANPKQIARINANAGFDVVKTAGIPGYAGGGSVSSQMVGNQPMNSEPIMVELSIQQDATGMFQVAVKSPTGRKVLLDVVGDGFANDDLKLKRR